MRAFLALIAGGLLSTALVACGHSEANPYPQAAQREFFRSCPAENAVCTCTWDKLTRDLTYDEYQVALEHFRETGRMDPKVTHARTVCTERHGA